MHKSDHVSRHRQAIGWLSVPLLTQHHTLCGMLDQYTSRGILLHPPVQFGRQHTYSTRCPAHFAMIDQCRLALSKRRFRQKAVMVELIATGSF